MKTKHRIPRKLKKAVKKLFIATNCYGVDLSDQGSEFSTTSNIDIKIGIKNGQSSNRHTEVAKRRIIREIQVVRKMNVEKEIKRQLNHDYKEHHFIVGITRP